MVPGTNFTEDENQKTHEELVCSTEFIGGVDGELIFISALNIFVSITAFLGNTLILVALHKETSLHPPSKLLYRNLAITDLCVGIVAEPLNVTFFTSVLNERKNICHFAYWAGVFSAYTLCSVSLLTSAAISVDRLLALLLADCAGAQIQTSCNFEKNMYNCFWFLDFIHRWFIYYILESSYTSLVSIHNYSSVSSQHNLRLHKNFLYSAS